MTTPTTEDVAKGLAALCQAGKFDEAGETYWADDIVSIEAAPGDMARVAGKAAVKGKGEWWAANHEVHSSQVTGPYLNGDQFTLGFKMELTPKATGQRITMDEIALYTVKDGKVVEERFFY